MLHKLTEVMLCVGILERLVARTCGNMERDGPGPLCSQRPVQLCGRRSLLKTVLLIADQMVRAP
jgi:hypothetical protein